MVIVLEGDGTLECQGEEGEWDAVVNCKVKQF